VTDDLHVLVPVEVGTLKEGDEFSGEFGWASVWKRFENGTIEANDGGDWDPDVVVYVRKSISPEVMEVVQGDASETTYEYGVRLGNESEPHRTGHYQRTAPERR
jgi:hypothetical protein